MLHRVVVLVSLLLFVTQVQTHADSWAIPTPRIYASTWGTHGFKVIPERGKFWDPAEGVLFTLDDKGDEKVVWKSKLVNVPYRVYLAPNVKHIVTIDTYATLGYKHALVVYNDVGKPIVDYALEDLLTVGELNEKVVKTTSSRHWTKGARFSFSEPPATFDIELEWGRTIKVDLATGKLK